MMSSACFSGPRFKRVSVATALAACLPIRNVVRRAIALSLGNASFALSPAKASQARALTFIVIRKRCAQSANTAVKSSR